MTTPDYDTDFYAWTQQQAEIAREARRRLGLPEEER
jgi:hypothetical protein